MKKHLLAFTLALVLLVSLAACSTAASSSAAPASAPPVASESGTPTESASLPAESTATGGTLTMATEATFPPYEYLSGSNIVGIDVDIATEIAKDLGLTLVIEEMPFDSVIAAVSSGKVDFAASGLSVTPERAEEVDFSLEYATSDQVIMTLANNGVATREDLAGKTIGVQMGTTADLELTDNEDYPNMTIERYNKYTDAVNDLINGRLAAIVLDSLPAEALKTMDENIILCSDILFSDSYAIAVQKGNDKLLNAINATIQRLIDEGKIDEFTMHHLP